MLRTIIKIDEDACNGCGLCVGACEEGAIGLIDGKARLLRDDFCDGLGNCLPACPTGAISFEEREAAAFNAEGVEAFKAAIHLGSGTGNTGSTGSCPGSNAHAIHREAAPVFQASEQNVTQSSRSSHLAQWPTQIKLVPVSTPFFSGAHLLIAADCCAYAYADFHEHFMKNHITLIGCPKLDEGSYVEKLTEIIRLNSIQSVTVTRMEVPCCGGIENAARAALQRSGKTLPLHTVAITTNGHVRA